MTEWLTQMNTDGFPRDRLWDWISHAGCYKGAPWGSAGGEVGETKQGWQREVKVRCRSETTLHNPRGALDLEWLFRVTPSWGSDSWALNLPHSSLFEYTSHSSQKPDETDRWSLSAERTPRTWATSPLLKELLGSMSQHPSQARTEIKH